MTLNARARKSIYNDLKKVRAEIVKKRNAISRLSHDIEKLEQEEADLDKSLED